MNCTSYQRLSTPEQIEFIGKLVVAVQTSETFFKAGNAMIEAAEDVGLFDKVKVGLSVYEPNEAVNIV